MIFREANEMFYFRKRNYLAMIYRDKLNKSSFIRFSAIFMTVMFTITVFLSFKVLTNDHCDCPPTQETIITYASRRKILNKFFKSNHKLAVLVPYRDRFEELMTFAPYIHRFLNEQRINHDIYVLNQVDLYRFNRASLINVGYLLTKKDYDYIAMHDVDLLPINKNLSYAYPSQPFHLAAPNLHPRYHYEKFIGGILLINREQFNLVKGLSNNYWGWGLEDDEFYVRLKDANLTVHRPDSISTGINDTFKHIHSRERRRDTTKCYNQREVTRKRDRITGLHDVSYKILSRKSLTIEDAPVTVINIQLNCNHSTTPWCDCINKKVDVRKSNSKS